MRRQRVSRGSSSRHRRRRRTEERLRSRVKLVGGSARCDRRRANTDRRPRRRQTEQVRQTNRGEAGVKKSAVYFPVWKGKNKKEAQRGCGRGAAGDGAWWEASCLTGRPDGVPLSFCLSPLRLSVPIKLLVVLTHHSPLSALLPLPALPLSFPFHPKGGGG